MRKLFIFAIMVMLAGMLSAQSYYNWGVINTNRGYVYKQTSELKINSGCATFDIHFGLSKTTTVTVDMSTWGAYNTPSGQIVIMENKGFSTWVNYPSEGRSVLQATLPPGTYQIKSIVCASGLNSYPTTVAKVYFQ